MRAVLGLSPWSFRCWVGKNPPPPKQGAWSAHLGYGQCKGTPYPGLVKPEVQYLSWLLAASTLL